MKINRIKLQYLIIGVALLAFMLTSVVSIWSGYKLNKDNLGESALETNRVYAQKLADTANNYLQEQIMMLSANVPEIAEQMSNEEVLKKKADLIRNQTDAFNSIAIVNDQAVVQATSPQTLDLVGVKLTSNAMKEAIKKKKPMISQPYESVSGRLIIFISVPLFSKTNDYLGLIGGTIYLKEDNVLSELLGVHPYSDHSTVYVAAKDGTIVYDENKENIGENFSKNKIIAKALEAHKTGVMRGVNNAGEQSFAGYSYIKESGWTVIAQRPADAVEAPAGKMVQKMLNIAIPLLFVSLIIVIFAAYKIAKPLQRLAELTESSKAKDEEKNFRTVPAWYYEAIQLKESLIISFGALHNRVHDLTDQSRTDALTGLFNRRTLDEVMNRWTEEQKHFSLILFDVDHFKKVNDTYGHDVGDEVLKYIAITMEQHADVSDLCFRFGGEEFVILLPKTNAEGAFNFAEKLRKSFEENNSPTGKPITISAGITECPKNANDYGTLIKKADLSLYYSKENGRNQVKITE